jgi:methyl-galactoside transport system substrate-binding protein
MKIIRKIITLIIITLIIFALTSTTQANTCASSSIGFNNQITNVAVILHRIDDPYMVRLRESLENIEKDNKNNVKYTFFDSKNNIAIQGEILDSALQGNFDLFILNSADKKENTVEDVINKVKQRNLPLILMNIPQEIVSKVSSLYNKVAFVTPDSKQAGINEGKIIVDLWNSNKKVIDKNGDDILQYVLLQGPSDDPQAINRTKYAISTINDSGIKTQQLELISGKWIKELAKSSIDNVLLKYNGRIEAIISNNDAMAIGAIEALQKYGYNKGDKSKNIAVVGIDGIPEAKDLIDKGLMTGTIIQDSKVEAEMFYTIGMNLVNNLNPTENTNYKIVDGEIIIPFPYDAYTGKSNNP